MSSARLRSTRRGTAGLAASTVVAALLVPAAAGAAGAAGPQTGAARRAASAHPRFDPTRARTGAATEGRVTAPAQKIKKGIPGKGQVLVLLELGARPAAAAYRAARPQGDTAAATASREASRDVASQQRAVEAKLTEPATRGRVLYRTHALLSGLAVVTDASRLPALAALPGVIAIRPMTAKQRSNAVTVPLIGAPTVWAGGNTGQGQRIGIVDTGIDYTHKDFGGGGVFANNRTDPTDSPDFGHPGNVVAGGYDFAGDAYDADPTAPSFFPQPDADPQDCSAALGGGHGTHVAGTAAGRGVTTAGNTYTGSYAAPIDPSTVSIGPGVAPGATLYALRVFGCKGSTNLIAQALDFAADPNGDGDVSDHLDVINMSLGSTYGTPDDPDAIATDNLAALGTSVVVAAGNGGDVFYNVGSPGTARTALTVAASDDTSAVTDSVDVRVAGGTPTAYAAENSVAYDYAGNPDLSGAVVALTGPSAPNADLAKQTADNSDGCFPLSDAQKAAVAGKVVFLEWDDDASDDTDAVTRRCGSAGRSNRMAAAGAVGALLGSNAPTFSAGITGSAAIPVALVAKPGADAVRAAVKGGSAVTVSLGYSHRNQGRIVATNTQDVAAGFTSRGGHVGVLKPDITAPGVSVFSAKSGTGSEGTSESGTSMATPHMAGVVALVRQAHPTWTPEQVKAAVVNTATQGVYATTAQNATLAPARVGAGRVKAADAVATTSLAYSTDPGAVSASFGNVAVTEDTTTLTRTVTVQNTGVAPRDYTTSLVTDTPVAGTSVAVSPSTLQVPAGGTRQVTLTLAVNRAGLDKTPDPSLALVQDTDNLGPTPRQYLAELSGKLVVTPSSGTPLRVPFYAAPRPASVMHAVGSPVFQAPAEGSRTSTGVRLDGRGVDTGAGSGTAHPVESYVSGFAVGALSPPLPLCSQGGGPTPFGGCLTIPSQRSADLKVVGANVTDLADGSGRLISIAAGMYGPWSTLNGPTSSIEVDFDTNGDGKPDFVTRTNHARAGADDTDVLVAETYSAAGDLVDVQPLNNYHGDVDTAIFNSDTVVLPVRSAALGLTPAAGGFTYQVFTGDAFSPFPGAVADATAPVAYDAYAPALSVAGGVGRAGTDTVFPDQPGVTVPVTADLATLSAQSPKGLLLVHFHNTDGNRTEVLPLNIATTTLEAGSGSPAPVGKPLDLFATVRPVGARSQGGGGSVAGSVAFRDGTTLLATVPVTVPPFNSGSTEASAQYTVPALALGDHSFTATFVPSSSSYLGTTSPPVALTATTVPTTVALATAGSPSAAGSPVVVTATVVPGDSPYVQDTPTGSVTFTDGATALGSAALVDGVATLSTGALALGSHTVRAAYGGDALFAGSTSAPLTQVVVINGSATALTVGAGPFPAGSAVPVAVTVTSSGGGTPTGTVTVSVDGAAPRTATLSQGTAVLALTGLGGGRHAVTAVYSGSGTHATSFAPAAFVDLLGPPALAALVGSTTRVYAPLDVRGGRSTRIRIKVSAYDGRSPVAGTVVLSEGRTVLATLLTNASGQVSWPHAFRKGRHVLTAVFRGNATTKASTSPNLTLRVF